VLLSGIFAVFLQVSFFVTLYSWSHVLILRCHRRFLLAGLVVLLDSVRSSSSCITDFAHSSHIPDLASHCRLLLFNRPKHPLLFRWLGLYPLYALSEIAIIATDLAELLGSAIALNMLFPRLQLWHGVLITACDVLILLAFRDPLRGKPVRAFELIIAALVRASARFSCKTWLITVEGYYSINMYGDHHLESRRGMGNRYPWLRTIKIHLFVRRFIYLYVLAFFEGPVSPTHGQPSVLLVRQSCPTACFWGLPLQLKIDCRYHLQRLNAVKRSSKGIRVPLPSLPLPSLTTSDRLALSSR